MRDREAITKKCLNVLRINWIGPPGHGRGCVGESNREGLKNYFANPKIHFGNRTDIDCTDIDCVDTTTLFTTTWSIERGLQVDLK